MNLIILGTFCKYNQIVSVCFSLSRIGEGNGNPLQCSCLGNPRDGGAWWAAVYGVAQSQTRLKRLSSSSSSSTYYILECIFKVNLMYVLQTYCTFFFSPVFYKVLSLIPFIHSSVYIYQYQPPNIYHLLFSPLVPIRLFSISVSVSALMQMTCYNNNKKLPIQNLCKLIY